jgi:hypothetical protein
MIAFRLSHCIFRPLRKLNVRMKDIINEGIMGDLEKEERSSKEIDAMYDVFSSLIRTKKFENNNFKDK